MPSTLERLLEHFLVKVVHYGNGTIRTASGHEFKIGDGSGKPITVAFVNASAQRRLVRDPEMALGEIYMDGLLEISGGDIFDLHMVVLTNMMQGKVAMADVKPTFASRYFVEPLMNLLNKAGNTKKMARKNVAHHYDLDKRLYDLFLDKDMQYSCAYFETDDMSLEDAQLAKKRHIAAKLMVHEGESVLDIGCGWGGLARYLATYTGSIVKGVTLSTEQLDVAKKWAAADGLSDKISFELEDYRSVKEKFDRVVSVGMLEHVGPKHYDEFFRTVRRVLDDDGVALIHTIGRTDEPGDPSPWMTKYIFPGGYIPALSELSYSIQKAGLIITDLEILRLHYAETLKEWRRRFLQNGEKAKELYDERFCRMWDFYLAASEASFRVGQNVVFQIQLTKKVDALPRTRGWIVDMEEALRGKDSGDKNVAS